MEAKKTLVNLITAPAGGPLYVHVNEFHTFFVAVYKAQCYRIYVQI